MSTVIDDIHAKQNIAANVRLLLRERDWSQARLARETGETTMMISHICKADHVANAATLARIAEVLRTSVDWLLADHTTESHVTA